MSSNVINLLQFFIVYSLIEQCVSSIFLTFGQKSTREEHIRMKNSNVHRGILFSLSADQKDELCEDFFSLQLYAKFDAGIQESDKKKLSGPVQTVYRWLAQREVTGKVETDESPFDEPGSILVCVAKGMALRKPPKVLSYISPTFRSKWFYSAQTYSRSGEPVTQYVTNFVAMSPDHINLSQDELEKNYRNTRDIIETLRKESPKYVELIEKRDNLSYLSKKQKVNLCACILSSPAYRQDRLEYSIHWTYEINRREQGLDYEEINVSLQGVSEGLKTDGILCKAFRDGIITETTFINMYITRSYANGYSAIVLKKRKMGIVVDKYFKNIAELITAQEDMNYNHLFLNISP